MPDEELELYATPFSGAFQLRTVRTGHHPQDDPELETCSIARTTSTNDKEIDTPASILRMDEAMVRPWAWIGEEGIEGVFRRIRDGGWRL